MEDWILESEKSTADWLGHHQQRILDVRNTSAKKDFLPDS